MISWLTDLFAQLGQLREDLSFALANRAVDAVRYQPRRMLLTGGRSLEALPGSGAPQAAGRASIRIDGWLDEMATATGERLGVGAEAWVRWMTGAAGSMIDTVGASAIDELSSRNALTPGMLQPHLHPVGVLFLDMRGFSKLTVALDDSQYLTEKIEEYLSEMTRVIEKHHGLVFQYTGDGLLALFLPELTQRDGRTLVERLAGAVSDELHKSFSALHASWLAEWKETRRRVPTIGLAVGVTYGSATIGLIGPPGKKYFGTVGPPVNLAAHLCSQAAAGTTLIDEDSFISTGATPPEASRRFRLKSEKLHQRIATMRIRPRLH